MSGPQFRTRTGTRDALLRILAETGGAATVHTLADQLGLAPGTVRYALVRPLRCGWVAVIPAAQQGWGPMPRNQYLITDKGRAHLASLTVETEGTAG